MGSETDCIAWEDRPLGVLSRVTSSGRGWSGLEAVLVDVEGGATGPTTISHHNINMHVGYAPLVTVAKCDEAVEERFQTAGGLDLLPAGSSVAWVDRGASQFMAVGLDHELIHAAAEESGIRLDKVSFVPQLTCRDTRIEHLMWALKAELEAEVSSDRLYAESLGVALAVQWLRRYTCTSVYPDTRNPSRQRLHRVLEYIDDRFTCDLTLPEIARVAGMSRSRLKTLFKQSMGMPVHRYVVRKRIECAMQLLTRTQKPICDVALQAGFANQSHMAQCMRRSLGVTPRSLREGA